MSLSVDSLPSLIIQLPEVVGFRAAPRRFTIVPHRRYFTWQSAVKKERKALRGAMVETVIKEEEKEEKEPGAETETETETMEEKTCEEKENPLSLLLWKRLLAQYGLTSDASLLPASRMEYAAFLRSPMGQDPKAYPSRCLSDRMIWYIEEFLLCPFVGTRKIEREGLQRRRLLRTFFRLHGLTWAPHYYDVYLDWVEQNGREVEGMNRIQRMERFMERAMALGWF